MSCASGVSRISNLISAYFVSNLNCSPRWPYMRKLPIVAITCLLCCALAAWKALAVGNNVIVGVNAWYRPPDLSQEDMAKQLAENGVKAIRVSLMPGSVDFITRASRHGVSTLAIIYPHTGSTAKKKEPALGEPALVGAQAPGIHCSSKADAGSTGGGRRAPRRSGARQ